MSKPINPTSLFLDSGAFSLWNVRKQWAAEHPGHDEMEYYDTDEFYEYLDNYAEFVQEHSIALDVYANVDVIGNPKLSWRNLKYLESKGARPLPVVHYGTDIKWLRRHIESGYDFIGLGGLVGSIGREECASWLDVCFDYVCDTPDRLPRVKLHGFGVTSLRILCEYPWYSVDSTSWKKSAGFGGLMVPHKRRGMFTFDDDYYVIDISQESPSSNTYGKHYTTLTRQEQVIIDEWIELIEVPLGSDDEPGLINDGHYRYLANLIFFEKLRESLPEYPWAFTKAVRAPLL